MTRPGMADGRTFGISGYKDPCAFNTDLRTKLGVTVYSNAVYREYLQHNADKVKKMMNQAPEKTA